MGACRGCQAGCKELAELALPGQTTFAKMLGSATMKNGGVVDLARGEKTRVHLFTYVRRQGQIESMDGLSWSIRLALTVPTTPPILTDAEIRTRKLMVRIPEQ